MKKKILIISSNYYKKISANLEKGAVNTLNEFNYRYEIIKAPGSFEIPYLIKKNITKYSGFIALGCVVKGKTYHFELICNEITRKIIDISIKFDVPIGFGVLTCYNMKQAIERSNNNKKNKGREAALACVALLK